MMVLDGGSTCEPYIKLLQYDASSNKHRRTAPLTFALIIMALLATISELAPTFANTSLGPIELDKHQFLMQGVYVKVENVFSNKIKGTASVSFTHNNNKLCEKAFEFSLDLEGPNPIKQAYLHLKSLPEFFDATDC
jgi:hypothetical protein